MTSILTMYYEFAVKNNKTDSAVQPLYQGKCMDFFKISCLI